MAVRIVGKVQGVGFRWFVQTTAERLGIRGWVRDTPSGDVELEAIGSSTAIDELRRRVEEGPPAARVSSVVELHVSSEDFGDGFVVRR